LEIGAKVKKKIAKFKGQLISKGLYKFATKIEQIVRFLVQMKTLKSPFEIN
jgi:hypothetical protein